MPPRLAIGVIGQPCHLADLLERAGHTVHAIDPDDDPGAIQHVDLVVLNGPAEDIRAIAADLAPHARPRQMFLHTALEHGPQLLDDAETAHAIVMSAHNLFDTIWVTSAADELGETLVAILIAEAGGTSIPIQDTDRPAIAAAQHLRALERTAREDAFDILRAVLPLDPLHDAFFQAPKHPSHRQPPPTSTASPTPLTIPAPAASSSTSTAGAPNKPTAQISNCGPTSSTKEPDHDFHTWPSHRRHR
ncbi:hypothetical protein JKI95_08395 [Corynebacterium aquatimens]|nr:hypothetical protein [Corynebacterium aquatimens]QYH19222.1 hypothetical protein JKI95_08395 [Corynebacterium aquatimens]